MDVVTCPQGCPGRKVGEGRACREGVAPVLHRVFQTVLGRGAAGGSTSSAPPPVCSETLEASLYSGFSVSPSVKWEAW